MMRKFLVSFLFIFIFLFSVKKVNASYTCGYNLNKDWWNLYIDYTVDGDKILFSSKHGNDSVIDVMDFYLDDSYENLSNEDRIKKLANFMDGKCEKQVYVCKGHGIIPIDNLKDEDKGESFSVLFDLQFQFDAKKYKGYVYAYNGEVGNYQDLTYGTYSFEWLDEINEIPYARTRGSATLYDGNNDCFLVDLYEDTTTGKIVDNLNPNNCIFYNDKLSTMKTKYKDCKDNGLCYDYNTLKSELRSHCNFVTQYTNYNNPCLYSCMNLGNDIAEIENVTLNGSSCNVSDKIWLWIANIFKWVKYFAPVLVIVLGILDFIKAIASQSDDEMKKVQGRFVKRLIAAALLFVIPFLIEFALNAFHLVTDNPYCSLI